MEDIAYQKISVTVKAVPGFTEQTYWVMKLYIC